MNLQFPQRDRDIFIVTYLWKFSQSDESLSALIPYIRDKFLFFIKNPFAAFKSGLLSAVRAAARVSAEDEEEAGLTGKWLRHECVSRNSETVWQEGSWRQQKNNNPKLVCRHVLVFAQHFLSYSQIKTQD